MLDSSVSTHPNGAFTLPDSDSEKVSEFDNITIHSYGTHIRIGSGIGIGSSQCEHTIMKHLYRPNRDRWNWVQNPMASASVFFAL